MPFHSMWFQHSIVLSFSCHVLSFNPTGLLTVTCGSNVQARLGRSIFSTRAKSCDVTSGHLSRAHVSSTATGVFASCCLKGQTNKNTQAAQLCAPPECSEAWQTQAAQPCAFLPCFFLLHAQNVAIAIQLAQGLRATGTLRNGRLMLSSSTYGGQKSGWRSNGKHSPSVRRNNDCGKGTCRKSCLKKLPQREDFELVW